MGVIIYKVCYARGVVKREPEEKFKSPITKEARMQAEKTTVGAIEKIKINGSEVLAKIDTGASKSSIDLDLAIKLKLGSILKKHTIISSHGKSIRPVIKAKLEIRGRTINAFFNIVSRSTLRYKVLIGKNILKRGFLIDPSLSAK